MRPPLPTTHQADGRRPELQGLRGVAILAVLLFHVWPSRLPAGYLGVDVFFVLSGYLMAGFIRRLEAITLRSALEFYRRRVKRIVPLYAGVLLGVLVIATRMGTPFEFHFLFRDALPAALFFSNWPGLRDVSYFDQNARFALFLHTWSLSVEAQFYALVPPLFLAIRRLERLNWTLGRLLVAVGIAASSAFQLADGKDADAKHVLVAARLWQFGAGFFAHDLRASRPAGGKRTQRSIDWILPAALVLFFFLPQLPAFSRVTITVLSALLVGVGGGGGGWLEWRPLVALGDVSFSVYLVHWPLLVAQRYVRPEAFAHFQEFDLPSGALLFGFLLLLGFCLEHAAKWALARVDGWRSLLLLVGVLYALLGANLAYIKWNARFEAVDVPKEAAAPLLLRAWAARQAANWTTAERIAFNAQLLPITRHLRCNRTDEIALRDGRSALRLVGGSNSCVEHGGGNKTVVMFGNSHAMFAHFGVQHFFADVFGRLSTIAMLGCGPLPAHLQSMAPTAEKRRRCEHTMRVFPEVLRLWHEPVDVLILVFGFRPYAEPPFEGPIQQEAGFRFMQEFYARAARHVRELVIVEREHVVFGDSPAQAILRNAMAGRLVVAPSVEPLAVQRAHQPLMRRRFDALRCRRCAKFAPTAVWCADGTCRSFEPRTGISWFFDDNHISAYGALHHGEQLRTFYERVNGRQE